MTMPGIITAPLVADPDIAAQGIDAVPSGIGESADPFSLTRQLGRFMERQAATQGPAIGPTPFRGPQQHAAPTMLDPDEANQYFSIPGQLRFDKPVPAGVASNLYQAKREELQRRDIAQRAPGGFFPTAARMGVNFAANALDPLNVAATFMPVVGEARYAEWLAGAGSALGRAGIRAGVGAAAGAVGQIPLEAIRFGLSRDEQSDWSARSAMLDIVMGGVLGGALHAGGGAVGDLFSQRFAGTPEARLLDRNPDLREAALRTSLAQMAEGRPVETRPLFDMGQPFTEADFERESTALRGESSGSPEIDRAINILRGKEATPEGGRPMMTELRSFGPLKDEGGELAALDINSKTMPGFVSKDGRSLDDAALHLWERGYFPEFAQRPPINDLLDAMREELGGNPRLRPADQDAAEYRQYLGRLSEEIDRKGMTLSQMSNGEVAEGLGMGPGRTLATAEEIDWAAGTPAKEALRLAAGEPTAEEAAVTRMADAAAKNADQATVKAGEAAQARQKIVNVEKAFPGAGARLAQLKSVMDGGELADLERSIQQAQAEGHLPETIPEIEAADAEMAHAAEMGKAWQAAAGCLARAAE